jgi:hypothetical protein
MTENSPGVLFHLRHITHGSQIHGMHPFRAFLWTLAHMYANIFAIDDDWGDFHSTL